MTTLTKIHETGTPLSTVLEIHGKRWFDRRNGNTYHSVQVIINGEHVYTEPYAYGYVQTAVDWLLANDYLPGWSRSSFLRGYCEDHNIRLVKTVHDVPRKKDL